MNGREQYDVFCPQGLMDVHAGGLKEKPQQQDMPIYGFFNNHQTHAHHQSLFRGDFGEPGNGFTYLPEGSTMDYGGSMGPQQGTTEGFVLLEKGETGAVFSQQQHQRLGSLLDYETYRSSSRNHHIPIHCLPLDQSLNQESFSSSFSSSECNSRSLHFEAGRQLPGVGFSGNSVFSQTPRIPGISKGYHHTPNQQQQSPSHHNVCRMPRGMGLGSRYPLIQQRTEVIFRQNSSPLSHLQPQQHHTASTNTSMHKSSIVMPGQHNHFECKIQGLENKEMHSYIDPSLNMQQLSTLPEQTSSQRLQHFDSLYLNAGQRSRFDFSNVHQECPQNIIMNCPLGLKKLSFTAHPGLSGEFTTHENLLSIQNADSVSLQKQNAAMMIKRVASWNQQQRMKQTNKQQLRHHGEPKNSIVHVQNMSHSGFERHRGGKIVHFDVMDSNLVSDSGWISQMHTYGTGAKLKEMHTNDYSGQPIGGQSQHVEVYNAAQGMNSSPGNYAFQSQLSPAQQILNSKIETLDKAGWKNKFFGQSCLSALSTACQDMIASLGTPKINITYNKKSQVEGKRKLNQSDHDMNASTATMTVGFGPDYFSANCNDTLVGPNQTVHENTSALSSCHNLENTPCTETQTTRSGKERRKRESGHVSPGINFPNNIGSPVMSLDQYAPLPTGTGDSKWGKRNELMLGDQPELLSTMDKGIQRVSKSPDCCNKTDFTNYFENRRDHKPLLDGWSEMQRVGTRLLGGETRHSIDLTENITSISECCRGVNHQMIASTDQVHTPCSTSRQDERHQLQILQTQIQRQQHQQQPACEFKREQFKVCLE
ncbi:transcriptional activator MN1-like [Silurus meridionalis]|uniref:transcriptional activator MN1-like n=1 Tax=Silurus meridionalis TaxID=175797 RepID=UPI001EEABFE6|nr:transcriptional activator MN1-like [Silurus meridionalis]